MRDAVMPLQSAAVCKDADNFYSVVNGEWQRATTLPLTEARITQAYFIREGIRKELSSVIRKEAAANPTGKVGALLQSWQAAEQTPIPPAITPILTLMMTIASPRDIAARIGWMNRYGISCPISIGIHGDPRDRKRCRVIIEEGQPRIGIPEYWLWPEYVEHRRAYATYIKTLAHLLGLPQIIGGYTCEREFAKVFPSALERRGHMERLTYAELCNRYTQIDWSAMMTTWGLKEEELRSMSYMVSSRAFMHHMQHRFRSWSLDRWRSWFALLVTQWVAGCSPHGPLRAAWFVYARRHLQGMPADAPANILREDIVKSLLPNTVGKLWVRDHCDAGLRRSLTGIIQRIRGAAIHSMERCSWMAASTRRAAVRKLRKMDIQVCWPDMDDWSSAEPPCGFSTTSFIDNMRSIASAATDKNIELMRRGDCSAPYGDGWGVPVFEVNAYYYPDENRFLLPAAILRPPFYDARRSLAWNYGGIGATIGHELCHAFDSEGRLYDEHGNRVNWWTARDATEYKKRAAAVVALFSSTPYRGMDVDGHLTLTENVADLGGLEFALAGLKAALGREPRKEELQEFFVSYAISWRAKDRLKRAAELLASDVHAPPFFRVNHTVRQLDAWYEAFDVGKDCEGYVSPSERIHFFA
jgi:putative endopeptidase